jgi:plastocyanin
MDTSFDDISTNAPGSPQKDLRIYLIIEKGPGTGIAHRLTGDSLVVGRGKKCDLILGDPSVSRMHFRLERSQDSYRIVDLASGNGTIVDDGRVDVLQLKDDMLIKVGATILRFAVGKQKEIQSIDPDMPMAKTRSASQQEDSAVFTDDSVRALKIATGIFFLCLGLGLVFFLGGKLLGLEPRQFDDLPAHGHTKTPDAVASSDEGYKSGMVQNPGIIQGAIYSRSPAKDKIEKGLDTDPLCVIDNIKERPANALLRIDGRVKNALVFIESIRAGKTFAPENKVIAQLGCSFSPRIQWAAVGTTLTARNQDSMTHDILATFPDDTTQHEDLFVGTKKEISLNQNGLVRITSKLHPWMEAYVRVFDHPYVVRTDFKGEFELTSVPPGTYEVSVWHEILGEQTQRVTVYDNETTDPLIFHLNP